MSNCDIKLFDRVKQKSTSTGTGNFELTSSVVGFKDFADVYSDQDVLFYCINDGTNFEIGSGIFNSGATPTIQRNVFYSSASDNSIIDFSAGTKEIFVTYPATHSVSIGSGIGNTTLPQKSGIAFWNCNNILDYDSGLVFDKDNKRIGIRSTNPSYAIDLGGDGSDQSMIRASGYHVGPTGLHFPSGNGDDAAYIGGIQFQHFVKNEILGAGSQNVLGLSGVVNQQIYFKEQTAGLFFAGPASGCATPCSPATPNFRPIALDDIPYIEEVSGYLQAQIFNNLSGISSVSGILSSDLTTVSGIAQNALDASGYLRTDLTTVSGISQAALDASGYLRTDFTTVSGIAQNALDASGYLRTDLTTVSGIAQDAFDASGFLRTDLTTISGIAQSAFDASGINDLYDVTLIAPVNNNEVIVYSSGLGKFTNSSMDLKSIKRGSVPLGGYNDSEMGKYFFFDSTSEAVINTDGHDINFRVEGSGENNLLFTDAANNRIGISTDTPSSALDINSSGIRIRTASTPTSSSSGNVGDIRWDVDYIYVCVSGDTWKRAALSVY